VQGWCSEEAWGYSRRGWNVGTSCICLCLTAWFQTQAYTEIPDFQIFYIYKLHRWQKHLKSEQRVNKKGGREKASWAFSGAATVGAV